LSDLGWGSRLRALVGDDSPDNRVPDEIYAGVVRALTDWAKGDDPWPTRPGGVVTVSSRRHPTLVADLGERIASTGRLPLLGAVRPAGFEPPPNRGNSAQRVRVLHDAFVLPDDLVAAVGALDGPVLLVDDLIDSGWTMAVVARQLRQAGAPGVLPFALALAG
jgi:ATP-dependent DNA helicase RecQ